MYRILVIGSVKTAELTIKELVSHGFEIVGVLGHEPKNKKIVSGWSDLKKLSNIYNLDYKGFVKINEEENLNWAKFKKPDIIFAVGFSQLLSLEWLRMPELGCIGFHPTALPKGRGRAPMAWIILEQSYGTATFFLMGEGADDGPIFVQEGFKVEELDDAGSIELKIEGAIKKAMAKWLPELKKGIWKPTPQNEEMATWTGKRSIEDGLIEWKLSSFAIDRLIKASTLPHPGAYTYFRDFKIIIWKSEIEHDLPIKGVVGRILLIDEKKGLLVQCGEGLLWLNKIDQQEGFNLKVGDKLGYNVEDEIFKLRQTIKNLNKDG